MAKDLGIDSLRYLPVSDLATTIGVEDEGLCLGCVSGKYPTEAGRRLIRIARENALAGREGRTFD